MVNTACEFQACLFLETEYLCYLTPLVLLSVSLKMVVSLAIVVNIYVDAFARNCLCYGLQRPVDVHGIIYGVQYGSR